jgi:hypothetical protein
MENLAKYDGLPLIEYPPYEELLKSGLMLQEVKKITISNKWFRHVPQFIYPKETLDGTGMVGQFYHIIQICLKTTTRDERELGPHYHVTMVLKKINI